MVADPQLVDPHTYPGRPWPFSSLTVYFTDQYLRRSFSLLQRELEPDTGFFLGDLFDGGREWSTSHGRKKTSYSADERWHKYGMNFWLKEYYRFGRIFIDTWASKESSGRKGQRGRKMITSLPGNHDLGLGNGIRIPVRHRFNAYFGESNRINVIGNHSFVSVDTVSLSAKGQANADAQGPASVDDSVTQAIWQPTEDFLADAKFLKARAVERDLNGLFGKSENRLHSHNVLDINDPRISTDVAQSDVNISQLPSILLTHVPLYRAPGTPCGPLREKYPPSREAYADGNWETKDDANAIRVASGVQYQNVLLPSISDQIIDKVGGVEYAFSGDDHDYCDVVHRGYTSRHGGVREITVKSISWAMGVRKPGVLLVSLWNPVDENGAPMKTSLEESEDSRKKQRTSGTIQTHLCLLPDQLTIFLWYIVLLVITITAFLIDATITMLRGGKTIHESKGDPLLPMTEHLDPPAASASAWSTQQGDVVRSQSPASVVPNGLSSRASGRSRASSALRGYDIPASAMTNPLHGDEKPLTSTRIKDPLYHDLYRLQNPSKIAQIFSLLVRQLKVVVYIVFPFYIWLVWRF